MREESGAREVSAQLLHDLKMPIQIQMNYVRVIEAKLANASPDALRHVSEDLEQLMDANYRLLRMINNFVDSSRIRVGAVSLNPAACELSQELRTLCGYAGEYARRKGIVLRCVVRESPLICRIDRDKLERIVLNLLSNAIKYTPVGGRITVSARRASGRVMISVSDSGKGIAPEVKKTLFSKYATSETDGLRGTGLGLSIVQALAELHGGSVRVQSTTGKGSRFIVDLPDAPAQWAVALPRTVELSERVRTELT